MSVPRLPSSGAPVTPPGVRYDLFDEVYRGLLGAGRQGSGYFVLTPPEETRFLFVLGGLPCGAGRGRGSHFSSTLIGDFFAVYAKHPTAPLLFCPADASLMHGLLVLFGGRPSVQVTSDLVDVQGVLERLAARGVGAVLALRDGERVHLALCPAGRPARVYFVPDGAKPPAAQDARDALLAFLSARQGGEPMALEVYETLEVPPAADAPLVNPPADRCWTQHYRPAPTAQAVPVVSAAPALMPQAELTVTVRGRVLRTAAVRKARFTIGRSPGSDLVIDNAGVSRMHAVIRFEDGQFSLEDHRSANGTFLNQQRITSQALKDGDEIGILKHRLLFRCEAVREAGTDTLTGLSPHPTVHVDPQQVDRLLAKEGSNTGGARLLVPGRDPVPLARKAVTIGSGKEATVRVPGVLVKPIHARITREQDGRFRLAHLGGLGPTKVNGERVTEFLLRDGDVITVGTVEVTVRLDEPAASAARPVRA
jgi:pSer/pThr/pTyr-binding forkhead associated (FHA) protein